MGRGWRISLADRILPCRVRGEWLIYRFILVEDGKTIHRYWSSACPRCAIKSTCTTGNYRRVARYEHEAVLDRVQARLDREPERMRVRRQTVGCVSQQ
jgi:hypothetical protein